MVESLHCTNCGAPLSLTPGQTLAACAYCNSTLRIGAAGSAEPPVRHMAEVPPEVVDEVKRLLVLGNPFAAAAYYARQTGVSEADGNAAVQALRQTVGYAPPLNPMGIAMLAGFTALGLGAAAFGAAQIAAGRGPLGGVLIAAGLAWTLLNWFALGRGLRAFWLTHRGRPAPAVVIKRWTIRTMKAAGEPQPVELVRFLLEVQPAGAALYETEANGMVRHRSYERTQPGCRMNLRYDPANPAKVVLMGPADTP